MGMELKEVIIIIILLSPAIIIVSIILAYLILFLFLLFFYPFVLLWEAVEHRLKLRESAKYRLGKRRKLRGTGR